MLCRARPCLDLRTIVAIQEGGARAVWPGCIVSTSSMHLGRYPPGEDEFRVQSMLPFVCWHGVDNVCRDGRCELAQGELQVLLGMSMAVRRNNVRKTDKPRA